MPWSYQGSPHYSGIWPGLSGVSRIWVFIKLDTNGTNPDLLESLIEQGMLDYVAMDIKAPFCKYRQVCCSPVNTERLERSIEILQRGGVEYEFRTTYTQLIRKIFGHCGQH